MAILGLHLYVASSQGKFVVLLTNDDPATAAKVYNPRGGQHVYTVCARYNGPLVDGEEVDITCAPSSQQYRHVIVLRPAKGQLCLAEVSVYARSKYCNISVSRRSRDVLTSRLGLVSVSAIYVSCPRPVFGQIVQATLTNRLLQTVCEKWSC